MLETMKTYRITQEMVDNVAQAYGAVIDRIMGAQDLDELVDGGEWSGPAAARKLERAHEQLFLEKANEYNVDVDALKEAVYDLLNEEQDVSGLDWNSYQG